MYVILIKYFPTLFYCFISRAANRSSSWGRQKGLRSSSDVKLYQRTEPLLVTRFCVSNAWLRKSTYHQGWVRAPEHSWTINDSQQTITKSESASTLRHCAEEGGVMIGFQWKWMSRRNRALGLTNSIGIITQKSPKVNEKIMGFSFQSPRPCHGSVRVSWQLADAGGETSVTQFVVITTDIWGPQLLIWGGHVCLASGK